MKVIERMLTESQVEDIKYWLEKTLKFDSKTKPLINKLFDHIEATRIYLGDNIMNIHDLEDAVEDLRTQIKILTANHPGRI